MEWKNTTVTVMGLGLNGGGVGTVEYLLNQGATVRVTDRKSPEDLAPSVERLQNHWRSAALTFVLGEHREQDFVEVDVVIKNPAIPSNSPYLQRAKEAGVSIQTDLQIFLEHHQEYPSAPPIIGITGTRGKTTTSTLIAHILSTAGKKVSLAGNVRKSVLDLVDSFDQYDYIVLELSSFQLADVTLSPQYAVITNMFPDHLNRYPSMQEYVADKQRIYAYQKPSDISFFWVDQPEYGAHFATQAPGGVVRISVTEHFSAEIDVRDETIYEGDTALATFGDIALKGEHNQINATIAAAVVYYLGVAPADIQRGLQTFHGVSGRQESVGEIGGVEYINDTTSTMPVSLVTALRTFADKPLHLICGGENKNLTYESLANEIHPQVKSIVLLPGEASQEIYRVLQDAGFGACIHKTQSLAEAMDVVRAAAQAGERVLFSPGATSFGQFQNEFDRGDAFLALVHQNT